MCIKAGLTFSWILHSYFHQSITCNQRLQDQKLEGRQRSKQLLTVFKHRTTFQGLFILYWHLRNRLKSRKTPLEIAVQLRQTLNSLMFIEEPQHSCKQLLTMEAAQRGWARITQHLINGRYSRSGRRPWQRRKTSGKGHSQSFTRARPLISLWYSQTISSLWWNQTVGVWDTLLFRLIIMEGWIKEGIKLHINPLIHTEVINLIAREAIIMRLGCLRYN